MLSPPTTRLSSECVLNRCFDVTIKYLLTDLIRCFVYIVFPDGPDSASFRTHTLLKVIKRQIIQVSSQPTKQVGDAWVGDSLSSEFGKVKSGEADDITRLTECDEAASSKQCKGAVVNKPRLNNAYRSTSSCFLLQWLVVTYYVHDCILVSMRVSKFACFCYM